MLLSYFISKLKYEREYYILFSNKHTKDYFISSKTQKNLLLFFSYKQNPQKDFKFDIIKNKNDLFYFIFIS